MPPLRVIDATKVELVLYGEDRPPYATLSHTWGVREFRYEYFYSPSRHLFEEFEGFEKIRQTCRLTIEAGLGYCWLDTCCIDRRNTSELSKEVSSMYDIFAESEVTFAYLYDGVLPSLKSRTDIATEAGILEHDMKIERPLREWQVHQVFANCRWFTRAWTLQELLASQRVEFYDAYWTRIGNKKSLAREIALITGIDRAVLEGTRRLELVPIKEKLAWAAGRETTLIEDQAYCLLGVLGIKIPIKYGVGEEAMQTLTEAIQRLEKDEEAKTPNPQDHFGFIRHTDSYSLPLQHNLPVAQSDSGYGTGGALSNAISTNFKSNLASASNLRDVDIEESVDEIMNFSDSSTIYSDNSTIPTVTRENHVAVISEMLVEAMTMDTTQQVPADAAHILSEKLPGLLKEFALRFSHGASSATHLIITHFVHKYRSNITEDFKSRLTKEENDEENVTEKRKSENMQLQVIIGNWFDTLNATDVEEPDQQDEEEPDRQDEEEPDQVANHAVDVSKLPDTEEYLNLIRPDPSFTWLVERLKSETVLCPAKSDTCLDIYSKIVSIFPPVRQVSKKKSAATCDAKISIPWNIVAFMETQKYDQVQSHALEEAITITGTGLDAQALTCGDYIRQTWPILGIPVITLLKRVLKRPLRSGLPETLTACLPHSTWLSMSMLPEFLQAKVSGTQGSIAEVVEILAWLSSALRPSPVGQGPVICRPQIKANVGSEEIELEASFTMSTVDENSEGVNGTCWHKLFLNPVIVSGFPIIKRTAHSTGLDIPFHIMAALVQTRRVDLFGGKLFIKGLSSKLVPIAVIGGSLIWHLLFNPDGSRISYFAHDGDHAPIGYSNVQNFRHIVGWCSEANYFIGSAAANLKIERSKLDRPSAGCVLEKVTVTAGRFITAGASVGIGIRDKPQHISREGYIPKLDWLSTRFVVLWDDEEWRGWIANGNSVLLYLLRASVKRDETGPFKKALLLDSKSLDDDIRELTPEAAVDFFLNESKLQLNVYPERDIVQEEETTENGTVKTVLKKTRKYFTVGDRLDQLYNILEKFMDHQSEVTEGVKLDVRLRDHLEGWDFHDIASNRDPIQPRLAKLETTSDGWTDLIRSLDALILFGRGFGELITPKESHDLCDHWKALPSSRGLLAASTTDIRRVIELYGDDTASPLKLTSDVYWPHSSAQIKCSCSRRGQDHTKMYHVLSTTHKLRKKTSIDEYLPLVPGGGIIFGHERQITHKGKEPVGDTQRRRRTANLYPGRDQDSGLGSSFISHFEGGTSRQMGLTSSSDQAAATEGGESVQTLLLETSAAEERLAAPTVTSAESSESENVLQTQASVTMPQTKAKAGHSRGSRFGLKRISRGLKHLVRR